MNKRIFLEYKKQTSYLETTQSRVDLSFKQELINLDFTSRIIIDNITGQSKWVWINNIYLPNQGQYVC